MAEQTEAQGAQEAQDNSAAQEQPQAPLKPENVQQMKIAMVTLATCLVEAMKDVDPAHEERFAKLLDKAYDNFRNNSDADPQHVLEVIHWTREMLSGWNPVPGETASIFGNNRKLAGPAAE